MSIEERKKEILETFPEFPNWEEKYRYVLELGRALPELSESEKEDKFLVPGCVSRAWLLPSLENGRVVFRAHSEAALVKGIIALLLKVYSDATPDEILATKAEFLGEIGVVEHLSMNRRNGLAHVVKQIQLAALAYKSVA